MEHHLISPYGWAQYAVNPVQDVNAITESRDVVALYLQPTIPLPHYRAMDIGPHRKTLTTAVAMLYLGYTTKKPSGFFALRLGPRTYYVKLIPAREAAAPLGHMAHALIILCASRLCDVSPLFALADPLDYPQYAVRVARAMFQGPEPSGRWLPGAEIANIKLDPDTIKTKYLNSTKVALDILSDPQRLQTLFRLVYDRSKEARALGYKLGLWPYEPGEFPVDPSPAKFTPAASIALLYVLHMLPNRIVEDLNLEPIKTL